MGSIHWAFFNLGNGCRHGVTHSCGHGLHGISVPDAHGNVNTLPHLGDFHRVLGAFFPGYGFRPFFLDVLLCDYLIVKVQIVYLIFLNGHFLHLLGGFVHHTVLQR